MGEGGGQVLRGALSLAMATGRPFLITNIRAKRSKPGLMRQHLAGVQLAAELSGAEVDGDRVGSTSLFFRPGAVKPGHYRRAVGTAGSISLVLQAVLPALLRAPAPHLPGTHRPHDPAAGRTTLWLEGGTHTMAAPPTEFLERSLAPALACMGAHLDVTLERHGYYPAGGGAVAITVTPGTPKPFVRDEPVRHDSQQLTVLSAHLPAHVAEREAHVLRRHLGLRANQVKTRETRESRGPGNAMVVHFAHSGGESVLSGFGSPGKRAEHIARKLARQAHAFRAHKVPVCEHLADQLIVPMALRAGGRFLTHAVGGQPLSGHAQTQLDLLDLFGVATHDVHTDGQRTYVSITPRA